jgi:broad specificity phosphatase PhoE
MLIAVRHGSTNENETDKVRGWTTVPLSRKGIKQSRDTADKLAGIKMPIDQFHTSDLLRARQTASIIGQRIKRNAIPSRSLRTWDPGKFSDKPVTDSVDDLNEYINKPNVKVPGGTESYNDFTQRVDPALKGMIEDDKTHLAVLHNRLITRAHALSKYAGKHADINDLKADGPVKPSGIIAFHPDWSSTVIKK